MYKHVIFSMAILVSGCHAYTQLQNVNWVFGDSIGLNFESGEPEFFETTIRTYEACASISNSAGNLLFYTNGQDVWNRDNEIMPNGDSLKCGLNYTNHCSMLQLHKPRAL